MKKTTVLFLCTHNSCRSQMAEGWCHELNSSKIDAYSAGTETRDVDKNAVRVMKESGVDISSHYSKIVDEYNEIHFDYVFTLCSSAKRNCPFFASENLIHVGFRDPSAIDRSELTDEAVMENYRDVRDEIRYFITNIGDYFLT